MQEISGTDFFGNDEWTETPDDSALQTTRYIAQLEQSIHRLAQQIAQHEQHFHILYELVKRKLYPKAPRKFDQAIQEIVQEMQGAATHQDNAKVQHLENEVNEIKNMLSQLLNQHQQENPHDD